jgi:HNH endonuclease
VLVVDSLYHRGKLKERLYEAGLKDRRCELCGQDERWQGRPMSLILDHINGVPTDNRLENLRIVCPNCAATLDTHCGRKLRLEPRDCLLCGRSFAPKTSTQRYCSRTCGQRRVKTTTYAARPQTRKVERPTLEQLQADLATMSYLAVGRKYGVSDNAVRKWLRWYEREVSSEAA